MKYRPLRKRPEDQKLIKEAQGKNRVKRSKTLAVTEYTKNGEATPKLYPLNVNYVADPEPTMPTVDELVEIGKNGMTAKQSLEYQEWMKKQAADLQSAFVYDSWSSINSKTFNSSFKIPFEVQPASDIRPKKVPTYETKPRKIDLE